MLRSCCFVGLGSTTKKEQFMANRAAIIPSAHTYVTDGGIKVRRVIEGILTDGAIEPIIDALDSHRGVLLASSYEYPGRYTRWDMGFVDPPLVLTSRERQFRITALNQRGQVLLTPIATTIRALSAVVDADLHSDELLGTIAQPAGRFPEEQRSKQPSIFSVLRALIELFSSPDDQHLGLYGAFGYDLAFQFEPLRLRLERPADQRDLVLYLPDELILVDHRREQAVRQRYDFEIDGQSTQSVSRETSAQPYVSSERVESPFDHEPGEHAAGVRVAKEAFRRGDLFEVVPGQTFFSPCPAPPSELFRRLRERNPAPYGFLINLGQAEYLVGASPEMYVRVDGDRVETCPIS